MKVYGGYLMYMKVYESIWRYIKDDRMYYKNPPLLPLPVSPTLLDLIQPYFDLIRPYSNLF